MSRPHWTQSPAKSTPDKRHVNATLYEDTRTIFSYSRTYLHATEKSDEGCLSCNIGVVVDRERRTNMGVTSCFFCISGARVPEGRALVSEDVRLHRESQCATHHLHHKVSLPNVQRLDETV